MLFCQGLISEQEMRSAHTAEAKESTEIGELDRMRGVRETLLERLEERMRLGIGWATPRLGNRNRQSNRIHTTQ